MVVVFPGWLICMLKNMDVKSNLMCSNNVLQMQFCLNKFPFFPLFFPFFIDVISMIFFFWFKQSHLHTMITLTFLKQHNIPYILKVAETKRETMNLIYFDLNCEIAQCLLQHIWNTNSQKKLTHQYLFCCFVLQYCLTYIDFHSHFVFYQKFTSKNNFNLAIV